MVYAFCVLVDSLTRAAKNPFSLIVGFFPGELSVRNQDVIRRFLEEWNVVAEMRELSPSPLFTERRHLTITTFSKFVIADLVPEAHLWVDIDTIARPGWDEIFTAMFDAPKNISLVVADKIESPYTRFDGFNAGVLGWSAAPRARWEPALEALPEKRFSSEQYLFNTLYQESVIRVDARFNFLSSWHHETEKLENAAIIHYSGPIKPWHLARRHRAAWRRVNPSWDYWFAAEAAMADHESSPALRGEIRRSRRRALHSGRLHFGKGSLASLVMRFLAIAGPLGTPVVWLIAQRAKR